MRSDDDIEGFIAYGLYKLAKREWNLQHSDEKSAPPTSTELAAYHRTWTDTVLQSLRDNAEAALSDYAQKVVQAARPVIEAEALRRGRPVWKDILIAVASAFTYSLLLLLAALIIRHLGVDLVEVAHGGRHQALPASASTPLKTTYPPHT